WRSARWSPGPCGPAARPCCSSGPPAATCRSRSPCSGPRGGGGGAAGGGGGGMAPGVGARDEVGARIGSLVKPELPVGWSGIREGLGKVLQLRSVPPRKVKSAPCQEVALKGDEVDLNP